MHRYAMSRLYATMLRIDARAAQRCGKGVTLPRPLATMPQIYCAAALLPWLRSAAACYAASAMPRLFDAILFFCDMIR